MYQDGVFCYYQDSKDKECDGKIHMKTECRRINVGHAVGEGVKPPKDSDINAMFCVSSHERTWYLYAETESDARYRTNALDFQCRHVFHIFLDHLTFGDNRL